MIVGALYFSLRPKKWETTERKTTERDFDAMHDEFAEVRDD